MSVKTVHVGLDLETSIHASSDTNFVYYQWECMCVRAFLASYANVHV